jgi:HEAT repeat protein
MRLSRGGAVIAAEVQARRLVEAFEAHSGSWSGFGHWSDASSIARIVEETAAHALPRVDVTLRDHSHWQHALWSALNPGRVSKLERGRNAWAALAVAASHRSGHVRQAALEGLARAGDGRAIGIVLLRLDDWVPEVRQAASDALGSLLAPSHAGQLARLLPLLLTLKASRRRDHAAWIDRIEAILRSPEGRPKLLDACWTGDRRSRLAALVLALDAEQPGDHALMLRALADPDAGMRRQAVRALATRKDDPNRMNVARHAFLDRNRSVRREAFTLLAADLAASDPLVLDALLDECPIVRWHARREVASRGAIDVHAFLLDAVLTETAPRRICGALMGLSEFSGTDEDSIAILARLSHPTARVRVAAIRALVAHDRDAHRSMLLDLSGDAAPSVARAARRALMPFAREIDAGLLGSRVADVDLPLHVRLGALELGARHAKWSALAILLDGCRSDRAVIADRARLLLRPWILHFNRTATFPARTELDRLDRLASAAEPLLPPTLAVELRSILGAARRHLR